MELFRNRKQRVTIENEKDLVVSQKNGCLCSKKESKEITELNKVIAMVPYNGGSCVAIASSDGSMNLKMNKAAVAQLIDRWNAIPKSFTKELLLEKKNLQCYVTSHGYLLLLAKSGSKICSNQNVDALCISMADIVLVEGLKRLIGKDTLFICSEEHAIEVKSVEEDVIERLRSEVKINGNNLFEVKAYRRAFKFTFIPINEYIYTTAKGVGYYYKKGNSKSEFNFVPWDGVNKCVATKGCLRKKMLLIAEDSILTKCEFPAECVKEIVEFVNKRVSDNAGNGVFFGKGKNKVIVTDTHVVCVGKKKLETYTKPHNDGKLIKKSWFSSYVNIAGGFEVKVGRYEWNGICCLKGALYKAVTAEPSSERELITEAEKHRY